MRRDDFLKNATLVLAVLAASGCNGDDAATGSESATSTTSSTSTK